MSDALDRLAAHPLPFATLMGVTFTAASADEVVATLAVPRGPLHRRLHRPWRRADGAGRHGGGSRNLPEPAGRRQGHDDDREQDELPRRRSVGDTLTATATPVHRGGRTQVWQTRITRGDGRPVALVTQTQMIL